MDLYVLQQMDGATPLGEIARRTAARYPDRFAAYQDALEVVLGLSRYYGCQGEPLDEAMFDGTKEAHIEPLVRLEI